MKAVEETSQAQVFVQMPAVRKPIPSRPFCSHTPMCSSATLRCTGLCGHRGRRRPRPCGSWRNIGFKRRFRRGRSELWSSTMTTWSRCHVFSLNHFRGSWCHSYACAATLVSDCTVHCAMRHASPFAASICQSSTIIHQEGTHDSIQDAKTALRLYMLKSKARTNPVRRSPGLGFRSGVDVLVWAHRII